MQRLNENLRADCCANTMAIVGNPILGEVKLYDRIKDACEQNNNFKWYQIADIVALNLPAARTTGIICRNCKEKTKEVKCVLSFKVNTRHTRFAPINRVEVK